LFHAATAPDRALQSFPLAAVVHPSRGDWLPCRHPPTCPDAPPPTVSLAVSPTPTPESAVAWFPRRLWVPFRRARRPASRSPWIEGDGTVAFRQLHRLRSFPPAAESVHATTSYPAATADALLVFRPSRVRPSALGASTPPDPKVEDRQSSRASPSASARDREDSSPRSRVGPLHQPMEDESARSAASSPLQGWAAPPLGGVSFSLDLCTAVSRRGGLRSF